MRSSRSLMLGLFAASALAVAGCKKKEVEVEKPGPIGTETAKVEVERVKIGSEVGADKKVVVEKEEFRPNETIYVSVETEGNAPQATMTAVWFYGDDQVVEE